MTSKDYSQDYIDQLPKLRFSLNYNNKVHCRAFTTIRTPDKRWKKGTELAVYCMDHFEGVAVVAYAEATSIRKLTDQDALLDIGHLKKDLVCVLYQVYPDYLRNNGLEDAPLVKVTLIKADEYFKQHDHVVLSGGHEPVVHTMVSHVKPGHAARPVKEVPRQNTLFG